MYIKSFKLHYSQGTGRNLTCEIENSYHKGWQLWKLKHYSILITNFPNKYKHEATYMKIISDYMRHQQDRSFKKIS